ncbi:hypothetical protein AB0J35_21480 [Nonomuraea angiospora]|uniref:hypothetical protein n=1 Tax=Nonomuraea angiospora TaxID=46172 RepID=UPI00342832A9
MTEVPERALAAFGVPPRALGEAFAVPGVLSRGLVAALGVAGVPPGVLGKAFAVSGVVSRGLVETFRVAGVSPGVLGKTFVVFGVGVSRASGRAFGVLS